jgi:dTMP kinase
MSEGLFITFEGTEGCGKSTQIARLATRLTRIGRTVQALREPGGTPVGEEIRHLLKHSDANHAMVPEAELLLMCASRAQLVREVIRPALEAGEIVLCDRFLDSTTVYQGHGRGLDREQVTQINRFAVGDTQPDLTLLFRVPLAVSEARRATRQAGVPVARDRMEEADRTFFRAVEAGYETLAAAEPQRVRVIDGDRAVDVIEEEVWEIVAPLAGA